MLAGKEKNLAEGSCPQPRFDLSSDSCLRSARSISQTFQNVLSQMLELLHFSTKECLGPSAVAVVRCPGWMFWLLVFALKNSNNFSGSCIIYAQTRKSGGTVVVILLLLTGADAQLKN